MCKCEDDKIRAPFEKLVPSFDAITKLLRRAAKPGANFTDTKAAETCLLVFHTPEYSDMPHVKDNMRDAGLLTAVVALLGSPEEDIREHAAAVLRSYGVVSEDDGYDVEDSKARVRYLHSINATGALIAGIGCGPGDRGAVSCANTLSNLLRSGETSVEHGLMQVLTDKLPQIVRDFPELKDAYSEIARATMDNAMEYYEEAERAGESLGAAGGSASSSDAPPPTTTVEAGSSGSTRTASTPSLGVRVKELTVRKRSLLADVVDTDAVQHTLVPLISAIKQVGEKNGWTWRSSCMEVNNPEAAGMVVKLLISQKDFSNATVFALGLVRNPRTQDAGKMALTALGVPALSFSTLEPPRPVVDTDDLAAARVRGFVEQQEDGSAFDGHDSNALASIRLYSDAEWNVLLAEDVRVRPDSSTPRQPLPHLKEFFKQWRMLAPNQETMVAQWQAKLEDSGVVMKGAFRYKDPVYLLLYGGDGLPRFLKWGTTPHRQLKRVCDHAKTLSDRNKLQPMLLLWLIPDPAATGTSTETRLCRFLTSGAPLAMRARLELLGFQRPVGTLDKGDLGSAREQARLATDIVLVELCRAFQDDMAWTVRAAKMGVVLPISPLGLWLRQMDTC